MSEEKAVKYNNGGGEFVDYFLSDAISTANKNFDDNESGFMPATVSVNGTIYSGYIIGGAAWCDINIKKSEATDADDKYKQDMKKYFTDIKERHYSPEAEKEATNKEMLPAYLHMLVDTILPTTIGNKEQLLWRFKACEVDGFSLGKLSMA